MDFDWSPSSQRPDLLYRIVHPYSASQLTPLEVSLMDKTLPAFEAISKEMILEFLPDDENNPCAISEFYRSIEMHRNGEHFPSPYISAFSDLMEAESWLLAADDLYGNDGMVMLVAFDPHHPSMSNIPMWSVQDIQNFSEAHKDYYLSDGSRVEYFPAVPLCPSPQNSEWLIVHEIPSEALVYPASACTIRWSEYYPTTVMMRQPFKPH